MWSLVCDFSERLKIILRNRAEYHLILSRRGRRPSWLNQGIFRKIEQDNCFIIQQILIDYHFQNEKKYGSIMKTPKAYYRSLELFTNSCLEITRQSKKIYIATLPRISPLPVN